MPPSMQFHSFLQPLVASLEESDCLGFRPKMALAKAAPEQKRVQKRAAKLGTGDPGALRQEVLRKECELAQLNRAVDSVRQAVQERQEWLVASGTKRLPCTVTSCRAEWTYGLEPVYSVSRAHSESVRP